MVQQHGVTVQAVFCDIIEPSGGFRVKWDMLVLLMLGYICIVGPYSICFGNKGSITHPIELMDLIINGLFVIDMYLNFRTAIYGTLPGCCSPA
jgi:hypothetical protein